MRQTPRSRLFWRVVLFGTFAVLALVAMQLLPLKEWLDQFRLWSAQLGIWGILLYGLLYGLGAMLMAPSIPFTLLAGFTFGWAGGMLAVYIGILLGAAGGFLVARYSARGAVSQRIERNDYFRTIDQAIAREGWKIVGLLRMCPVPFGLSNYLYGLTGISFWRYMLATIIGMLPGNIMFVYLGVLGKVTLEGPHHPLEYAVAILGLLAMFGVVWILKRIAQKRVTAT